MTSFLLFTALACTPGQATTLKLTNVRTTYGELGSERTVAKYLPGDAFYVSYDIEGFTLSPSGNVQYRMALQLVDKAGKPLFTQDPADKVDFVPLGGTKLPARAFIYLGLDMDPGTYTMKLTVIDTASKQQQTLEKSFEVLKPEFGIVRVSASIDESGQIPASTTGVVGQSVFIVFAIVGFEKDKLPAAEKDAKTKVVPQPNVSVEMTPLDESGKPTIAEPAVYKQNSESPEIMKLQSTDPIIRVRFLLPMSRTGKYTVRLKATDNNTKKVSIFELPIVILPAQ